MNKITVLLFGCILSFSFVTQLLPDKQFSEQENRYLQTMPKLTWSNIISGKFTKRFESYIQDHFFLRDEWMKGKTHLEQWIGKHESNDVYPSEDGKYFEVDDGPNQKQLDSNISNLQDFVYWLQEKNIDSSFVSIYSAYMFYEENLPKHHLNYDQASITKLLEDRMPMLTITDTLQNLVTHKDEEIYFATDHHWTQLGAYYAYEKIANDKGWEAISIEEFAKKTSEQRFFGTLYSKAPRYGTAGDLFDYYVDENNVYKVSIPDSKKVINGLYEEEFLSSKDKYSTFLGGNNGLVVIEKKDNTGAFEEVDEDNSGTLLMFKDSYSHALVPFLTQHYDKIVMIDLRYFNSSVQVAINQFNPAEVIFAYHVSWFGNDTNTEKWKS